MPILNTYDVMLAHVFRLQAPTSDMAQRIAKNFVSVSGIGLEVLVDTQFGYKDVLTGADMPSGPRNPNRTDIGVNGHKKVDEPQAGPEGPKLALDDDGA